MSRLPQVLMLGRSLGFGVGSAGEIEIMLSTKIQTSRIKVWVLFLVFSELQWCCLLTPGMQTCMSMSVMCLVSVQMSVSLSTGSRKAACLLVESLAVLWGWWIGPVCASFLARSEHLFMASLLCSQQNGRFPFVWIQDFAASCSPGTLPVRKWVWILFT